MSDKRDAAADLRAFANGRRFGCVLADPPWRFTNRTGKMAPEHRRLSRYGTLTVEEIRSLPIAEISAPTAHAYLWVPNALLEHGLAALAAWGFEYKTNIVWHKTRKDGGSDGRGVGFYFRNVTELVLFGVRGKNARTFDLGRRQVNSDRNPQTRAQQKARRALPDHRRLQPRAADRAVRQRHPPRLDRMGKRGAAGLCSELENICAQFGSGAPGHAVHRGSLISAVFFLGVVHHFR